MRRINILFALVLMAWATGCAAETPPPEPMANHCPIYGYEDLGKDDRACTTEPVVVQPLPGFLPYPPDLRMTLVSGVPIQYWILRKGAKFSFKDGNHRLTLGDRPYVWIAVYRYQQLDVITITASDVCRVDWFQRYEGSSGIFGDFGCWYENFDLGKQIDHKRAQALFPGVTTELEAMATRSGRNFIYSLAGAFPEDPNQTTTTLQRPAPAQQPGNNQL